MQPIRGSVVIPTFNSGTLVVEAVASVLAQSIVPEEIIVVDDGSTDDTPARMAPFGNRVRYIRQENRGVSAARNRGIETATGDLIAFLDADDVWHPRKWELQLQTFARQPELGLIGTKAFPWPDAVFASIDRADSANLTRVDWHDLVVKNRLTTSSIVVRREALDRSGKFDTTLQGPEDRDLWLRIAATTRIANLDLPLTGYRDVPGSVSKNIERCKAGMLRILDKLESQQLLRGRPMLRRKAYSYVHHSCAYLYGAAGAYGRSVRSSVKSLGIYPLPYRRDEVKQRGERPKRLLVNLAHWLGFKPSNVGS